MSKKAHDALFGIVRFAAAAALTLSVAGMLAPVDSLPQLLPSDLLLHAVGFGAPAILACFAATSRSGRVEAIALIAAAGCIAELSQAMVPGRTVSALDLMANLVGIGCGAWLGWLSRAALGEMSRLLSASRAQS
jgi:VanZ family protein